VLTLEEARILKYLRAHQGATLADVARLCLGGMTVALAGRAVANLDWLGYVAVCGFAESAALLLTNKGQLVAGSPHNRHR
jgi:hypothetical protein